MISDRQVLATDTWSKYFKLENIQKKYDEQTSPYYAAAHLWVDAIIDPLDTRQWISMGIEAANGAPLKKTFNMGVLQV